MVWDEYATEPCVTSTFIDVTFAGRYCGRRRALAVADDGIAITIESELLPEAVDVDEAAAGGGAAGNDRPPAPPQPASSAVAIVTKTRLLESFFMRIRSYDGVMMTDAVGVAVGVGDGAGVGVGVGVGVGECVGVGVAVCVGVGVAVGVGVGVGVGVSVCVGVGVALGTGEAVAACVGVGVGVGAAGDAATVAIAVAEMSGVPPIGRVLVDPPPEQAVPMVMQPASAPNARMRDCPTITSKMNSDTSKVTEARHPRRGA
jgi:hypothetical protein